ncbi:CDF family cation diffusion facilitator [Bifidobacterium parmae]|uniref:CDF family cation diffusion facilitator n=2 Tax=Bifidobacterium parmae TaxID=361854 RepID=A0A2N5J630_9BIFI|nr:CDF family cation diffusion facilitator [Bifidobacterium parmae]
MTRKRMTARVAPHVATRLTACVASALLSAAMLVASALAGVWPGAASSALVPSAYAAGASVAVSVDGGTLNPDGNTAVALSGSGFQSVKNGFGGIYVLFGWVSDPGGDSWKPSQGGVTGETYKYVPDDENDPAGYDVFVAFPGSSTASAANGGTIAADGTWGATITVPGARFTSTDRSGNPSDVDCTAVQCGIITIGAHGVANANNETFTPLTFGATASSAADAADSGAAQSGESGQQTGAASGSDATGKSGKTGKSAGGATTADDAARQAADVMAEGANMGTPTLGVAGWLIVAAAIILGIAVIVLAAGYGGYLAAKSLLLGVSPAALEKEMARRERRAEAVRAREELKSAKRRRKQAERLAREQAKAGRAQGLPADAGIGAAGEETQVLASPMGETTVMPAVAGDSDARPAGVARRAADIRGFFTRHAAADAATVQEVA